MKTIEQVTHELKDTAFGLVYETKDGSYKQPFRRVVRLDESVIRPNVLIVTFSDGSQTNVFNN
jgi:hypothetical protein